MTLAKTTLSAASTCARAVDALTELEARLPGAPASLPLPAGWCRMKYWTLAGMREAIAEALGPIAVPALCDVVEGLMFDSVPACDAGSECSCQGL